MSNDDQRQQEEHKAEFVMQEIDHEDLFRETNDKEKKEKERKNNENEKASSITNEQSVHNPITSMENNSISPLLPSTPQNNCNGANNGNHSGNQHNQGLGEGILVYDIDDGNVKNLSNLDFQSTITPSIMENGGNATATGNRRSEGGNNEMGNRGKCPCCTKYILYILIVLIIIAIAASAVIFLL